ncbi:MAG: T9SS type A sorting domain-containing protein [Sphingobacteriales bacterium]|nr:MAG: T9SS type A sorting domain-containing protein [Sphingobacteriales bacterium]
MYRIILFTFFLFLYSYGSSQTMFERTYGQPSYNELAVSHIQTSDGGYALLGYSASYGNGSYDIILVKTDLYGNQQWQKNFGGELDDLGVALQQTADGGYILLGKTGTTLLHDILLIKTDQGGNEQWSKVYGSSEINEEATELMIDTDGGFLILGGNPNFYLLKTNASGDFLWDKNYSNTYLAGQSLQRTTDGGLIICGSSFDTMGGTVMLILKTDGVGETQWIQTVADSPSTLYSNQIFGKYALPLTDGGYLAVGFTQTDGFFKIITHKTNPSGGEVWTKVYEVNETFSTVYGLYRAIPNQVVQTSEGGFVLGGCYRMVSGNQAFIWQINSIGLLVSELLLEVGILPHTNVSNFVQTTDGNLTISGYTSGLETPGYDALLLKTDLSGNQIWAKTYGENGNLNNEWGYAIWHNEIENTYLLAGQTNSFSLDGNENISLIKVDSNGDEIWQKEYDFQNNNDAAWGIAPAIDGGYALFGYTTFPSGNSDMYLLKIDTEGNKLWDKTWNFSSDNRGWNISATPDGGFVVVGQVSDTLGASVLTYLAKLNSDGDIQWDQLYGLSSSVCYSVKPVSDGGYILAGRNKQIVSGTSTLAYLLKVNNTGQVVWEFFTGNSPWSRLFDVTETSSGTFMAVGTKLDSNLQNAKMLQVYINGGGGLIWEKTVDIPGYNFGNYKVLKTTDGNFAFLGNVELQTEPLDRRGYLLKTDVYGNEIWSRYYGETIGVGTVLYDAVYHLNDWGFVLFGGIQTKGTTNDFYLIKTDYTGQTPFTFTGTSGIDNTLASNNSTLKVIPNPNQGSFKLQLPENLPINETIRCCIFNTFGQKIFEIPILANPLHQKLDIELPVNIKKGLYLIRIQTNSMIWQSKMLIHP